MGEQRTVLHHDDGQVRVVILNRPERRNAIDLLLRVELDEVLRAAQDASVRALVLTGAGGTFCSGGDISTMARMEEGPARERTEAAHAVVRALREGPPVVAAVEGAAFGAGLALALACDVLVAAADTRISASFTRVGLAGDMGISLGLTHRVGAAAARRMLMLPEELDGVEAGALGIVDEVTDPGAAEARAIAVAHRLAEGPPLALRAIKRRFDALAISYDAGLDAEAEDQVRMFATEDLAEAAAAFAERRPPMFRGR